MQISFFIYLHGGVAVDGRLPDHRLSFKAVLLCVVDPGKFVLTLVRVAC